MQSDIAKSDGIKSGGKSSRSPLTSKTAPPPRRLRNFRAHNFAKSSCSPWYFTQGGQRTTGSTRGHVSLGRYARSNYARSLQTRVSKKGSHSCRVCFIYKNVQTFSTVFTVVSSTTAGNAGLAPRAEPWPYPYQ